MSRTTSRSTPWPRHFLVAALSGLVGFIALGAPPAGATDDASSYEPAYAEGQFEFFNKGEIVAPGGHIGLCRSECFDDSGNIDPAKTGGSGHPAVATIAAGTGSYTLNGFPKGSYKVAVKVNGVATGYLAIDGPATKLVTDFTSGSTYSDLNQNWSVTIAPPPTHPKATWDVKSPMWGNQFSYFELRITKAEPNTSVKAEVIGCRGALVASKTRRGSGAFNFRIHPKPRDMGKNWRLRVAISAPGHATYRSGLSNFIGKKYFPACRTSSSAPRCSGKTLKEWRATGRKVIVGTRTANKLVGTRRSDVIHGLGGNDTIRGGGGNDIICGGSGRDTIFGGSGQDVIRGNAGDDRIHIRNRDRDRAYGGAGKDVAWADRHELKLASFTRVYR